MKNSVLLFMLCLGLHPAWSDAPVTAPKAATAAPAAKPPRPKSKVIDLDFGPDEDVPRARDKAPASIAPASKGWVYWTMGATVAAAAVGGAGWYWYKEKNQSPTVIRSEQVFTDDR